MSMYHMMTGGFHPMASLLLHVIGVNPKDCVRLRNVYIVDTDDGPVIYVLCRSPDNPFLEKNPLFLCKKQCIAGDSYWEYDFRIPDEYRDPIVGMGPVGRLPRFAEHFEQMMRALEKGESNPIGKEMLERAKPFMTQLVETIQEKAGINNEHDAEKHTKD